MLESFYLSNFKAFGEKPQHVKVKPLTLIFGPNSAGKSSIIHSVLLLNELHKRSSKSFEDLDFDIHFTDKGGSSVDLGGFPQYIFKGELDRKFSFTVELSGSQLQRVQQKMYPQSQQSLFDEDSLFRDDSVVKIQITAAAENLDDQDRLTDDSFTKLDNVEITADGLKLIKLSNKIASEFAIDWINISNPVIQSIIENIFNKAKSQDDIHFDKLINHLTVEFDSLLPSSLNVDYSNITKKNYYKEIKLIEKVSELLQAFSSYFQEEIEKVEYLGPLRSYPPRRIDSSKDNDPNWISGGGFAWKVARDNKAVREKINDWLSSEDKIQVPYKLSVRHLHTIDSLEDDYRSYVEDILGNAFNSHLDIGETKEEHELGEVYNQMESLLDKFRNKEDSFSDRRELVIKDVDTGTEVSHRDIGIGISQILPVLVSAYGNKHKTIAIEQPEIHLHPKIQSSVVEVFLEAVRENGNRFILETHSEHLIKALQIEVAKFKKTNGKEGVSPEDVSILYVSKNSMDQDGASIKEMELDDKGSFKEPWPDDFFEKSSQLTLERLKQVKKEKDN